MICLTFLDANILQFRALVRNAVNRFFIGDPKEHSDLEAVHKAMGLSGKHPLLSSSHRVFLEAERLGLIDEDYGFVRAPLKTTIRSSALVKEGQESKILSDFQIMLGMSDCLCLPL